MCAALRLVHQLGAPAWHAEICLKSGPVKTGATGMVVPTLFILGEQDEKNLSTFSNHFAV